MAQQSTIPERLLKQFEEMTSLPPNDLHSRFLTSMYKLCTRPLKEIPFIIIIPLSIFLAVFLYLLLGPLVVSLVSFLQHGF